MKLNYIDIYKYSKIKNVKKLYINSFPKDERYPFWLVKKCAKTSNVQFNVILDKDSIIGMEYLLFNNNDIFLFYLAIEENNRGNGIGSIVLKDLEEKYKDRNIILCIERIDNLEDTIKIKRKNFYLRNGFYETNTFTEDNGVRYEVLCTNKDYKITSKVLSDLYKKMSERFIYGSIMKRMFNVENAHMID